LIFLQQGCARLSYSAAGRSLSPRRRMRGPPRRRHRDRADRRRSSRHVWAKA